MSAILSTTCMVPELASGHSQSIRRIVKFLALVVLLVLIWILPYVRAEAALGAPDHPIQHRDPARSGKTPTNPRNADNENRQGQLSPAQRRQLREQIREQQRAWRESRDAAAPGHP